MCLACWFVLSSNRFNAIHLFIMLGVSKEVRNAGGCFLTFIWAVFPKLTVTNGNIWNEANWLLFNNALYLLGTLGWWCLGLLINYLKWHIVRNVNAYYLAFELKQPKRIKIKMTSQWCFNVHTSGIQIFTKVLKAVSVNLQAEHCKFCWMRYHSTWRDLKLVNWVNKLHWNGKTFNFVTWSKVIRSLIKYKITLITESWHPWRPSSLPALPL